MMCTTVLHGGVCNHTYTPHKSGNKLKEKKKKMAILVFSMSLVAILAAILDFHTSDSIETYSLGE